MGTGRTLNIPFGLWLAGAGSVTTFDLKCYLRPELIAESLSGMRQHEEVIRDLFVQSEVAMRQDRFASLLACRTAAEAMTASLDPYTEFESKTESEDNMIRFNGRYGGVGMGIKKSHITRTLQHTLCTPA